MHSIVRMMTVAGCLLAAVNAGPVSDTAGRSKVSLSGMVELESAELVKARVTFSHDENWSIGHNWYSHFIGTLNFDARPSSSLELRGSFEFRHFMNMAAHEFDHKVNINEYNLGDFSYSEFYIREGQGIFSLLNSPSTRIDVAVGLMPYKYNAEVRDLGEFLFRSGTYPFYLNTDFNRPFARLTGLRIGVKHGDDDLSEKVDVMALTEREIRPYWDLSFAAIGSVNWNKVIDLGAGIDLAHYVSPNSSLTTPKNLSTQYKADSTMIIGEGGDTSWNYSYGYYTFKGIKVMANATIDPLGQLRGKKSMVDKLCGKNGGKIYGEYVIIGLKNYPANSNNPEGYDKLSERSPWMIGMNIPFWKIFDVCSVEFERYPSPLPNNTYAPAVSGDPLPYYFESKSKGYDADHAFAPRWYWSINLEKEVLKNMSFIAQIGRDHQRWEQDFNYITSNRDYEAAMENHDEWGWHLEANIKF